MCKGGRPRLTVSVLIQQRSGSGEEKKEIHALGSGDRHPSVTTNGEALLLQWLTSLPSAGCGKKKKEAERFRNLTPLSESGQGKKMKIKLNQLGRIRWNVFKRNAIL